MKQTIFLLFLICMLTRVTAQEHKMISVVKTYDGSVYQGKIISDDILQIRMVIATLDTITINKSSIKKIRSSKNAIMVDRAKFHKKGGIFYKVQSTFGVSSENNSNQTNLLSFIVGKRLTPKFHVGGGVGFAFSTVVLPGNFWTEHHFVNLFAYGKYNLNQKKWRPYIDLSAGIGINAINDNFWNPYTNGLYIQPGIGFDIANRKKVKWTLKISQYIQKTSGSSTFTDNFGGNIDYRYDHLYNRTTFTVGINF